MRRLAHKVYYRLLERSSNFLFRDILATPPRETDPESGTVLYSLLNKPNYRAYLLAAKSFLRYCPPMRVAVQSDGTLDEQCSRDLRHHLPGVELLDRQATKRLIEERADPRIHKLIPDLDSCHVPLVYKLFGSVYNFPGKKVILFDSDLLFLRNPEFVVDWIRDGRGYCFQSDGGNSLTASFRRMGFDFSKVDINAFNAGFIGFHCNIDDKFLWDIIERIKTIEPDILYQWEVEQAVWAVLYNRMENPTDLDSLTENHSYVGSSYWPYERARRAVFVHFVSSTRWREFMYLKLARKVIQELKTSPRAAHVVST